MSNINPTPSPVPALSTTLLPSILRTLVPIIYALLVRWGVVEWLSIGDMFINNLITAVVTTLFYVLLRVGERYKSQIGWLLGYAQQPVYVSGEVLSVVKEPTPVDQQTARGPAAPTTTTHVETTEDPTKGDLNLDA